MNGLRFKSIFPKKAVGESMIEIHSMKVVSENDPLSKALGKLSEEDIIIGVVDDKGKLIGIIDDRHLSKSFGDASKIKVRSVAVKSPRVKKDASIKELLLKFSTNHFAALPVVDENGKAEGFISRVDVLKELMNEGYVPNISVESVMSTPPHKIESEETLGRLRAVMKNLAIHHMIVVENGKLIGVITPYDLISLQFVPELKGSLKSKYKVKDFIRSPPIIIEPSTMLPKVVEEFIEKKVSYGIVAEGESGTVRRPVGFISVRDILNIILRVMSESFEIVISGLPEHEGILYDDIKEAIDAPLQKIAKMVDIGHVFVRIKEGKSVYNIDMSVEFDGKPYHFHGEDYKLLPAVKEAVEAMESVIKKLKDVRKDRRKKSSVVELIEEEDYL